MKTTICVFALMVATVPVAAQTDITGPVLTNTTWSVGGSPYTLYGSIFVDGASTLTIDPGVVIKFDTNALLEAQENSNIVAAGTAEDPILFTSAAASPAPGNWNFAGVETSTGSEFSHCVFEYAKYNLVISRSSTPISYCTMRYAQTDGISCFLSSPTITDCDITNNGRGIKVTGQDANPVINNCNLYDNNDENLYVTGYETLPPVTIDAENNWWGTDDEIEIGWTIYIHPNSEGFVEVDYDPWLHDTGIEEDATWGRLKALFAD